MTQQDIKQIKILRGSNKMNDNTRKGFHEPLLIQFHKDLSRPP